MSCTREAATCGATCRLWEAAQHSQIGLGRCVAFGRLLGAWVDMPRKVCNVMMRAPSMTVVKEAVVTQLPGDIAAASYQIAWSYMVH